MKSHIIIKIKEGDKVRLNVEKIKLRKDYPRMQKRYQKFVDDNKDTVFTVHYEKENSDCVTFVEDNTWLFWNGDLKKEGDENV